jgi:hypothetical protein
MAAVRRGGSVAQYNINAGLMQINLPAGIQTGDIGVIAVLGSGNTANPAATGWTTIKYLGAGNTVGAILWKVMAAADSSSAVQVSGTNLSVSSYAAVDVWGGVNAPTISFARSYNTCPSASAVAGSVPLYVWLGYDKLSSVPPTSLTAPAGWVGAYASRSGFIGFGAGLWFTDPTTGTSAPGGSLSGSSDNGITATIVLPPSAVQNMVLAGASSAQDIFVTPILAGANAGADVNLVYTP